MDWEAFLLSIELGIATVLFLTPIALWAGRALAYREFRGKGFVEALVALPLLLPPTVVGFYLLVAFGRHSPLGQAIEALTGQLLAFSFEGLVIASILVNIPFAFQPVQRAFEAIEPSVREAGAVSGLTPWQVFRRIELPLAWPGIVTGLVLTFAHTLGEFGVVLMVGGSIPGETKTIAIAIYDRVQAFDDRSANIMAATLLVLSIAALGITNTLSRRIGRRRG
ncbi:molybdate ABC transporter permease subunit [Elioraea tepidiphila]|jgi:molybdate transport system permease protein|uniref:molybdate ABC transporter permease subunit n=1 Tax=Elioraea tepidiphila TaxID=457934 RepID=UPI0003712E6F|nr:molybdate ABC transporter permease subunit [Elioraea tepidiphila]